MEQWIPSEEETFAHIGRLFLMTQDVEEAISHLIGIIYPKGAPSWEELGALKQKTLGSLIRTLKERADIHPKFEDVLAQFLEGRNTFVHKLSRQPGFDMHSEAERDEIWKFLEIYQKLLQEIWLLVIAAILKRAETAGMPETKWHEELRRTGFMQEIKSYDARAKIAFRGRKP
jgi:hypothetical protein